MYSGINKKIKAIDVITKEGTEVSSSIFSVNELINMLNVVKKTGRSFDCHLIQLK